MVVAVASPSSAPPAAARPHPTYKEMVVQALTELRQPAGSTRLAIAKYIADRFSGLPAHHDALLSAHLRRLKSQGVLRTSGYSYLLSSSSSSAPQQRRGRGRPPKNPTGEKRGPGRPRKDAALAAVPVPVSSVAKRRPGRPRKDALPLASSSPQPPAVKRGPGRPPKIAAPLDPSGVKRGPGRPRKNGPRRNATPAVPVLGEKRGRGRPPKNAPIRNTVPAMPNGKLWPGRPRKSIVTTGAVQGSSENAVVSASVAGARRGRGRPPKATLPAHSGIAASAMPSLVPGKRKRGRSPMEKRRPGRPRKDKPLQPGSVLSGDAALTKRGPGRPRKEKTLEVGPSEDGGAVAAEMTGAGPNEAGGEAEPVRAVGKAGIVQNGGEAMSLQCGVASSTQKRGRGRPRKEKPSAVRSAETGDAASIGKKRGRGRPRKGKSFETGFAEAAGQVSRDLTEARPRKDEDLVSGEKTETEGVEAEPVRAVGKAGIVQNGGEAMSLQCGVASSTQKRGRGRPRKEKPSAVRSAETGDAASIGKKRGRGRPRKRKSFETGFAEAAGQVSRDLTEARPRKDEDLVSGENRD